MILLQVFFSLCIYAFSSRFCVCFLFLIYCSTQENQGYFHYHTTIQPTYPLPPSLPSFSLSCLPHQLYPTNTAIFTPNTYSSTLHNTQITISPPLLVLYITHTLPSHLPYLRYTMHTHYHLTMPTPTPLYMFHQLRTYTTTTDGTHTGHASLSLSFPLENLFSCDSYCQ